MRADSGFYAHEVVAVCRKLGVRFSITIRAQRSVRRLIEAIPESAWAPIPYWMPGGADVAETVEPTPESLRGRDVLILSGLGTEAAAEVCRRVKGASEGGRPGICVLTASDDVEARVALLQSGADEVLVESVDPRELEARIEALLETVRARVDYR